MLVFTYAVSVNFRILLSEIVVRIRLDKVRLHITLDALRPRRLN